MPTRSFRHARPNRTTASTPTPEARFSGRVLKARKGLDDVQERALRLVLPVGAAAPYVEVSPPLDLQGVSVDIGRVQLFTNTTKMRCASFSLPAGPPKIGGTCPAAAKGARGDAHFVCFGCYATAGNYLLPSVQASQRVRLAWVRRALDEGIFAEEMAAALGVFLARPRRASMLGPRGVPPVFLNGRYFRIHDSGDFSWYPRMAYADAWASIARRFPAVRFWAPTRDWVFRGASSALAGRPENFVVRPSALRVGDPSPAMPGLDAGSTVDPRALPAAGVHDCPAYRSAGHSCESAGCRACWDHPAVAVNYAPHGAITAASLVPLRTNPARRTSLGALFEDFSSTRANAPAGELGFGAYLAERGVDTARFSEEDWRRFLAERGVDDPDEQAAVLESLAEWS